VAGYEWDGAKRLSNLDRHGVDFAAIEAFEWSEALTFEDRRFDYGETREVAVGILDGRLHVAVFQRREGRIRLISLREGQQRRGDPL
jgi:uncharacterized DUF497 family protein